MGKPTIAELIGRKQTGRKVQGIAAALLPYEASGRIAVDALQKLADRLDIGSPLRQKAAHLEHAASGPDLASDVIEVSDGLFTAILAAMNK